MATVRILPRSKKSITLIVDYGIDPVTKKRKTVSHLLNTTDMEEAKTERLKILVKLAENTYVPPSKLTIKEYFEKWLTTPPALKLSSKTFESYKNCITLRIVPWLGHIKVHELKRSDLMDFYNKIYEVGQLESGKKTGKTRPFKPVSKDVVLYHHSVIRRILNDALFKDEIIEKNVALKIDLPEPAIPEDYDPDSDLVKVFSQKEIGVLERHTADTSYYALIFVALRTGMRRGELLALTWDAIDYSNSTVFVKRSLSHTKERGYEYKLTKNKKRRKIEVTKAVLDVFRSHAKKQTEYKNRLGDNYSKGNLIFCREDGNPLHPDTISSWFPDFCDDCGITRLTFHCLRHTHASHLLAEHEDISYVSRRLGHSDIYVTYNRYFHLIPLERRKSLSDLDKRFKNKTR
ncbi:MAG: integrase family protein [Caproiciproducens sp.]|nr:integrase family protein [Caproiciproducens sp.]